MPKAAALEEAKEWLRNLSADQAKAEVAALPRGEERVKAGIPKAAKPYAHPHYWAAFILAGDPR